MRLESSRSADGNANSAVNGDDDDERVLIKRGIAKHTSQIEIETNEKNFSQVKTQSNSSAPSRSPFRSGPANI
jgi:hypothetical protein